MAEAIGLASGITALATLALKSSIALHDTISSYHSHQQRVRDLVDETDALSGVLGSLNDTLQANSNLDLGALDFPLRRCAKACQEFNDEIKKCSSRCGASRASFRDWARMRYMGDDIDGFRRLLASYKVTINVALTHAALCASSATAENMEGYSELLQNARGGLEDRLEIITSKLDDMEQRVSASSLEAPKIRQIKEEKVCAEKGLEHCAQLSMQIEQIQPAATQASLSNSSSVAERIAWEGLEDCKSSLSRMAAELKSRERELFRQLTQAMGASAASSSDAEAIASLREEWESTQQSMKLLSSAGSYLGSSTSVIENRAKGDAFQIMVSTNGKTLHGTNRADGWRARQFGGHMDDATVRHLSQDMLSSYSATREKGDHPERPQELHRSEPRVDIHADFVEKYGKGFKV